MNPKALCGFGYSEERTHRPGRFVSQIGGKWQLCRCLCDGNDPVLRGRLNEE